MSNITNVLIAAVGGQGALLAARIFGNFATARGFDVKISEIHGMSQRGGSVVTHVRFGEDVRSPVIEAGTADTVIAFELLEAARYVPMLRPGGTLVANTQRIQPLPVLTGTAIYPDDLLPRFARLPIKLIAFDAFREAEAGGNVKAVNCVLLGAYAKQHDSDAAIWHQAIAASVREAHRALNIQAFDRGQALSTTAWIPSGMSEGGIAP